MEQKIEGLLRLLKIEFILAWVVIIALIAGYECEVLEEGALVGNANAEYVAQLTGVLLAICLIPMSLRIFNLSLTKYIIIGQWILPVFFVVVWQSWQLCYAYQAEDVCFLNLTCRKQKGRIYDERHYSSCTGA